ncbi:MAG: hypothetical protein IPG21_11115 [Saprospiraceae bacterium]|nr:hypothetical protein [Candidatus Vicinibacter affinis]
MKTLFLVFYFGHDRWCTGSIVHLGHFTEESINYIKLQLDAHDQVSGKYQNLPMGLGRFLLWAQTPKQTLKLSSTFFMKNK